MVSPLLIIGIIIVVALGLWLVNVVRQEFKRNKEYNFIFNLGSKLTGKRAYGIIVDRVPAVEDREIIYYKPMDLDQESMKRDIKPIPLIVEKNKNIILPKGTLSKDKNIEIPLPPTASDFPDDLKDTFFGKIMMFGTEIKNASNVEIDTLRDGLKRTSSLIKKVGTGEATEEWVNNTIGFTQDLLKLAKEARSNQSTSSLNYDKKI